MPETAPQRIGKYEITDLLGQGAMGVVYRALDPVLSRYVAIKVMSHGIAADQELRDRFMREARAAGSLQHPNIITIYDFGDEAGSLYIAMEYIEGSDLSEIMARRDPLPLGAKLDILIGALHALDYAHSRGVVHRDVKPANIRVSTDGRAKLMDFGIARLEKSDLTKSGMMVGTPDYMAPEQVTGGVITPATDVFAMGVVLYEFLTNRRTFDGDTLHAVLYKVVSEQPPALRSVSQAIPPSLQPIVDRALAKDPTRRYQSAGDMARDLAKVRAALGGDATVSVAARATPLRTMRISGMATRKGWTPKRRRMAIGGGAVAVLAAAALLAMPKHGTRAPDAGAAAAATSSAAQAAAARPTAGMSPAASPESGAAAQPVGSPAGPQPGPSAAEPPVRQAPAPTRAVPSAAAGAPQRRTAQSGTPPSPSAAGSLSAPAAPPPAAATSAREGASQAPAPVAAAPAPSVPAPSAPAQESAAGAPPASGATRQPADPRPALEALVAAYARAIESRSVAEIRRVYPRLTDAQQQSWEQFFQAAHKVSAELGVSSLDVNGSTADLAVTGTLAYDAGSGTQRQAMNFRATAVLVGDAWTLMSVR